MRYMANSELISNQPLLDTSSGEYRMWSEKASPGTTMTTEAAATYAAKLNRPGWIIREFASEENERVLLLVETSDSVVTLMIPSSKYTDYASMVCATRKNLRLIPGKDQISTDTIYDLNPDTQACYWQFVRENQRFYESKKEILFPDGDGKMLYVDNNMFEYTNPDSRTSRTIGSFHGHNIALNYSRVSPKEDQEKHIAVEQRITQAILRSVDAHQKIAQEMQGSYNTEEISGPFLQFAAPYGYYFRASKNTSDSEFALFMKQHHDAYTRISKELEERYQLRRHVLRDLSDGYENTIKSPSYRTIMNRNEDGSTEIYISPAFFSPAGPFEALNISLSRHPDNPPNESQETQLAFYDELKQYHSERIAQAA